MKSISEFLEKWKNRKWSKTDWLICILGGILLLVIAWPSSKESGSFDNEETEVVSDGGNGEMEDYEKALEKKLEEILGTV